LIRLSAIYRSRGVKNLHLSGVDLENAVFWAVIGITAHNGQICVAGSRLYVQKGIYDKFVEKFREMSLKAVAGDPLLQGSSKGPVISKVQHEKILGHIQKGVEQGAKLLYGGKEVEGKGNFVENTVFVDGRMKTANPETARVNSPSKKKMFRQL
jgi:acyl-CoA reductase-like NAD-dependent aldehyde dehydrogenase